MSLDLVDFVVDCSFQLFVELLAFPMGDRLMGDAYLRVVVHRRSDECFPSDFLL